MPAIPETKTYDFDLDGVKFSAEIFLNGDGRIMAKVVMQEGSADFNSVFWGDADQAGASFTLEGDAAVVNLDALNCRDVQFDSGMKLSLPVGPGEVLSKDTYLTAGETGFITLPGVTSIDEVAVIGVHATNASTPDGEINAIAGDDLASYCEDDEEDDSGDDCDGGGRDHDGRGHGRGKGRDDDDDHDHHGHGKGRDDDDDRRHHGRGKGRDDDHRDNAHGKGRDDDDCDDDNRGGGKGKGRDDDDDDGKGDHKWSLKSLLGKHQGKGKDDRNDDDDDKDDDEDDHGKGHFSMKFDAAKFYEAFVKDFGSIEDRDREDDLKDEDEDENEEECV